MLSASVFGPGVAAVYLATGSSFADALAAGPAAAVAGGPVLLTDPLSLPAATATELGRLRPARVIVVGGSLAVSDAVASQAGGAANAPVTRVAGASRYETAAMLSGAAFQPGVAVAYLATGSGFADALAAGPAAAAGGGPVLLTDTLSLPAATAAELARLHPAKLVVTGGSASVSDVVSSLAAVATGVLGTVLSRVAGATRYETATLLAGSEPAGGPMYVATGAGFADALAAVAVVAHVHGSLALVSGKGAGGVPGAVADLVVARPPSQIVVIGGSGVVDDTTMSMLPGVSIPGVAEFTTLYPTLLNGGPGRWNPCAPIPYVVNVDQAPSGTGLADVQGAVARVSAASGLTFTYQGASHAYVTDDKTLYDGLGYDWRPAGTTAFAPLLVTFEHPSQAPGLASTPYAGLTGAIATQGQIVSGWLIINPDLGYPGGFNAIPSNGRVLMHELGHAVGLDHAPTDATEMMFPGWSQTASVPAQYGPGDFEGLRHLGPLAGCLPVLSH